MNNYCPVCNAKFDKNMCSRFEYQSMNSLKQQLQNMPSKDELYHISWQTTYNTLKGISYFTNYPVIKEFRFVLSMDKMLIWKDFNSGYLTNDCELQKEKIELFFNCKTIDEVESKINKLIIFENGTRTNQIIQ